MLRAQLCYDVAYGILPRYTHTALPRLISIVESNGVAAGPFFYVMACKLRDVDPAPEDVRQFRWHRGNLDEGREFLLLEYPSPEPIDLSGVPVEELTGGRHVLAPHFSAVIHGTASATVSYYVLGQAPMGGGTTLRAVRADGANANLGAGPAPEVGAFLDVVRARTPR